MKKYYQYLLISFFFYSCITESYEKMQLTKSHKSFGELFELSDSIILSPKDFSVPISITVTPQKEFLLCDYEKKKVQLLDSMGNFVKDILKDTINGNKMGSPISIAINGNTGNYYIADNSNRRVITLDSNFKFISSFIISGAHMTPIFMQSIGGNLYMTGHNVNNDKFIHVYSNDGRFQKSFLTNSCPMKDNKYVAGAINYVKFDTLENSFFAIEIMNYTISVYDSSYQTIRRVKFSADFFPPLNKDTLAKIKRSFEEIRNSFAKPNNIMVAKNQLLVFSEMPIFEQENNSDYFNSRKYNLDIFSSNFSNNISGIDIGSNIPIANTKNGFYFLTSHNTLTNTYTVKRFKLKL